MLVSRWRQCKKPMAVHVKKNSLLILTVFLLGIIAILCIETYRNDESSGDIRVIWENSGKIDVATFETGDANEDDTTVCFFCRSLRRPEYII